MARSTQNNKGNPEPGHFEYSDEFDFSELRTDASFVIPINGWKKGGVIALNLAQVSLSNWSAGGQNSISTNGLMNLHASYKKENSIWENFLDLGFGGIRL